MSRLDAQWRARQDELIGALVAVLSAAVFLAIPLRPPTFWGTQFVDWVQLLDTSMQAGGPLPLPAPRHAPIWPALIAAKGWDGPAVVSALRLLALFSAVVTTWSVYHLARLAGGWRAGVGAAVVLWLCPPYLAAVSTLEPTIYVLAASVAAAVSLLRARTSSLWILPALLATTVLLLSHVIGWAMLLIAGYLFLAERGGAREGKMRVPPLSLGMVIVPIAAVLALKGVGAFGDDALAGFGEWMATPLRSGLEPSLYFGRHYGPERIPVWLPLAVLSVRIPPTVVVFAGFGALMWSPIGARLRARWSAGEDALEGMRGAWVYFAWFAALPAVVGGPYLGFTRLFALIVPWIAVLAGWSIVWAAQHAWRATTTHGVGTRVGLATVFALLVASTLFEATWAGSHFEAYYSPLVARTEGAVTRGFSRAAHAPVDSTPLQQALAVSSGHRVSVLSSAWEYVPVLEREVVAGVLPPDTTFVRPAEADVYVLVLDDNLPELYGMVEAFQRLASDPEAQLFESAVHGTPLVMALSFGR